MSATALLTKYPNPTDAQIESALEGNICRCGTYLRLRQAIHKAAAIAGSKSKGSISSDLGGSNKI
jgi:isoquinoline 1-oxidoreductase alpha subunit